MGQLRGGETPLVPMMSSDAGAGGRIQTGNVGSGGAPTDSHGPSSQLIGTTDDHPEEIRGPISAADAARVFRSKMPLFQPCYTNAREVRPMRVSVRLSVQRDGHVTNISMSANPPSPAVQACLQTALQAMIFPTPTAAPLVLVYPLQFAPPVRGPVTGRGRPTTPAVRPRTTGH